MDCCDIAFHALWQYLLKSLQKLQFATKGVATVSSNRVSYPLEKGETFWIPS